MPKVKNPLHSEEASGQLAQSIVYSRRKGQNVVRSWARPANPQSNDQGDQRIVVGGLGRAASAVKAGSDYALQLLALNIIPTIQTKQSYLVQKIHDTVMNNIAAYEAEVTEFGSHTAHAGFTSEAAALGLADFDLAYAGTSVPFAKGVMLYEIAKLAITLGFTGAPYSTALASWTITEIQAMVADMAAPTP